MRFTSCWCMCRVCHFWAKSPFIVSRVKKKSRLACWRRKSEHEIASSSSGRFHILLNMSPCRLRLMVYRGHFEDEFDDKNKQFQLNVEQKMMKNEIDIAQKACIRVSTVEHPFHADTEHQLTMRIFSGSESLTPPPLRPRIQTVRARAERQGQDILRAAILTRVQTSLLDSSPALRLIMYLTRCLFFMLSFNLPQNQC